MNWKKVRIGFLIVLGLIILIPALLYLIKIDLSKKHTARISALPVFTGSDDKGEFRLPANEMEFLIRVAGMQNEGPAVILLHGFPESSIVWQPLLDAAADKGYRVLAFDQRGYSPGARPSGTENYQIDFLVEDVLAVANQVGFDQFHLVGHDWGSGVGWKLTMDFPERVHTWTAMAIPHIGVFFPGILHDPEQKKRSSYMNTLRTPILPELLFQLFRDSFFERVEGVWKPQEIAEYKVLHSEHGATTATLNWYRALDFEGMVAEETFSKQITRPTLFIWGEKDGVVAPDLIPKQEAYIDAPFQSIRMDAGHSLMQEKTEEVLEAVISHWSQETL